MTHQRADAVLWQTIKVLVFKNACVKRLLGLKTVVPKKPPFGCSIAAREKVSPTRRSFLINSTPNHFQSFAE